MPGGCRARHDDHSPRKLASREGNWTYNLIYILVLDNVVELSLVDPGDRRREFHRACLRAKVALWVCVVLAARELGTEVCPDSSAVHLLWCALVWFIERIPEERGDPLAIYRKTLNDAVSIPPS